MGVHTNTRMDVNGFTKLELVKDIKDHEWHWSLEELPTRLTVNSIKKSIGSRHRPLYHELITLSCQ